MEEEQSGGTKAGKRGAAGFGREESNAAGSNMSDAPFFRKKVALPPEETVPPLLTMTDCIDARNFHIGEIERSQFWDCAAVYFQNSGKMFTREKILNHQIPRDDRFIYFAVNVRFFNIQGTNDHIVDSVGMSTLYLPDVQYHFRDLGAGRDFEVDWVINHAYNVLCYIYANQCPFKSGDTVDAICLTDGSMDTHTQWKVQYENALIQPVREVLDICMNEYAAGTRQ